MYDFDTIVGNRGPILLLPLPIVGDQGGMPEYLRAWQEEHRRRGRDTIVLDRLDPRIAWASKKRTLYVMSIVALLAGAEASSLLASRSMVKLLPTIGQCGVIQIPAIAFTTDALVISLLRHSDQQIVVGTLHDPVAHPGCGYDRGWRRRLFQNTVRNCWRLAAEHPRYFLHLHNPEMLRDIDRPPEAKIIFHEHPIPATREKRRRNDNDVRIGVLGRIEQYKGIEVFLQAVRIVQSRACGISAIIRPIIAGRGRLDMSGFSDLSPAVSIENRFLSDGEFHQRMADLDVLVLPYVNATQSGVAAMGIAYGVRIIASNVGGIPRLLEAYERGCLVPARDPQALADAIFAQVERVLIDRGLRSDPRSNR